MFQNEYLYIWTTIGLLPYRIKYQRLTRGERRLEVQALFWSLDIHRQRSTCAWSLKVPLIEKLRKAVWVAVVQFQELTKAIEEDKTNQ